MLINRKYGSISIGYDDPVTTFWVELPSGRRLCLGQLHHGPYDTEADAERAADTYAAELTSMVTELRSMHLSDCAIHNEPAYPAGPCDCKK